MKIAIHDAKGSFSERWIKYCRDNNIDYKIVIAYDFDIIKQIEDCDAFMWHHHHANYKDALFAKQLLFSLQQAGKKVFPDINTTWHFDDKVGQKYLLEAIGAPLVPSYVFYSKKDAIDWINKTTFPKVFKLRGGAGATNVKLVQSKRQAMRLVNKAFGKGFAQFNRWNNFKERIRKFKSGKDSILGVCKGLGRLIITTEFDKMHDREKGYVYFQDFIPNNNSDTRIVVVGNKALGERRFVRKNDFRASGSGEFSYENISTDAVEVAFKISKRLSLQSVAFDFIFDSNQNPLIIEMSYGFGTSGIKNSPGYWDNNMNWHEDKFDLCGWMVQQVM
jgi:glutathione synthase/RimK-type ligase-like ATP-grasp enzyme